MAWKKREQTRAEEICSARGNGGQGNIQAVESDFNEICNSMKPIRMLPVLDLVRLTWLCFRENQVWFANLKGFCKAGIKEKTVTYLGPGQMSLH